MRLARNLWTWITGRRSPGVARHAVSRQSVTHIIILDGTASSLEDGRESNAGLTYKLLCDLPLTAEQSLYYEPGIQWRDWASTQDVVMGRGINRQIRRAYGYLASRYHPGDRIVLIGYSRGAFAVRSLAGVIDRVGLVRAQHATVRNIRQAYRHYQTPPSDQALVAFRTAHCHAHIEIEMVGVWDTVKALGLRLPLLWKLTEAQHAFHNYHLGKAIRHGFHALALDETRQVFKPLLWDTTNGNGSGARVEQVWFRGCHGDVGGQLNGFDAARPLSNIALVWMLERMAECGAILPGDWRDRFPCDADAPSVGSFRGWGKLFLFRRRRKVGRDPSERLHPSVGQRRAVNLPVYEAEPVSPAS